MESRLEKIFSMGINSMSLAVWLGEDRKCSAAVVGLDLLLGLSMVRRCSLNRFYCFCREPCKVGLTKRQESPNCGRCFLICAQKTRPLSQNLVTQSIPEESATHNDYI